MGRGARTSPAASLAARASARAPIDDLGDAIRACLSDDLRSAEYQGRACPYAGHCYVASEAYYHLMGGKGAGYTPVRLRWPTPESDAHWWLVDRTGQIIDLTAEQFAEPVPYERGRGGGFQTREPSRRARELIDRVRAAQASS